MVRRRGEVGGRRRRRRKENEYNWRKVKRGEEWRIEEEYRMLSHQYISPHKHLTVIS